MSLESPNAWSFFVPFGQGLHPLCRSAVEARPAKQYSPTAENRFAETSTPDRAIPCSVPALTFAFRAGETTPPIHAARVTPKPRPPLPETPNELIHPPLNALIHTPVHVQRLCSLLSHHPDKFFSTYVSRGMSQGFAVGFRSPSAPLARLCSSSNHPSALRNRQFVSTYLQSFCDSSQTAGPFTQPPFPHMYVSGLGIVPKKNGKLRVIHDLSSPDGESVNDGIPREDFSPEYATVDLAVSHIMAVGPGAYLTKVDVRNAFRLCPVRPADWFLLGIYWEKHYYYDRVLPFGLRSAPYIFNKLAARLLHRSRPWTKSTGYEYNSSRLSLCSHRSQPFEGLVRACQGSHDMAPLITSFPSQMPRNQRQIPVQYCPDIQGTTTRRRKLRKIFFDGALMVISCLLPRVVLAEGSFVASL